MWVCSPRSRAGIYFSAHWMWVGPVMDQKNVKALLSNLRRLQPKCHVNKSGLVCTQVERPHGERGLAEWEARWRAQRHSSQEPDTWGARECTHLRPSIHSSVPNCMQLHEWPKVTWSHPADPSQPRVLCKAINHCFKFRMVCSSVIDNWNNNASIYICMCSIVFKSLFTTVGSYSPTMQWETGSEVKYSVQELRVLKSKYKIISEICFS